jgi:hypothetical protein
MDDGPANPVAGEEVQDLGFSPARVQVDDLVLLLRRGEEEFEDPPLGRVLRRVLDKLVVQPDFPSRGLRSTAGRMSLNRSSYTGAFQG